MNEPRNCRRTTRFWRLLSFSVLIALSTSAQGQTVEDLRLTVGKSIVLDYPADVRQISTSDPAIVDAMAVSTREVLLHAKASGTATVVVWARTGQRTIYSINVEQNLEPLRRLFKDTFPTENIQVQSSRDSLSLTGSVSSKEAADRAVALATPFGKTVVNNLVLAAAVDKQIVLRVKFAELDRTVTEQFGVNLISTGAGNTIGSVSTGQFSPPRPTELAGVIGGGTAGTRSSFTISDALNVFAFRPDLNLSAFVRALQTEGVLQILAEPNLVTTNGKEATFLVGGEFPIPVLQGGGNAGAVTIQFREFGIRLTFNPTITNNNTIKMYVKPEVSTIDLGNAVTVSGFLIPALATRRMETNVELGEGQSFVIGGLIDDRVSANLNKIPGLSNIPLLGALFKSREERKNHTELVVMVTPEITQPMQPGDRDPVPAFPREFLPPLVPPSGALKSESPAGVRAADGSPTVAQVELVRQDKKDKKQDKKQEPKQGQKQDRRAKKDKDQPAKEPKKG
jgi:pilus assembly protein CpaC